MADGHIKYDPSVVQQFADDLYAQADRIIMQSTAVSALMGALAGYVIAVISHEQTQTSAFTTMCAVIAGLLGYVRGREKAFKLKLEAQMALCQIHTERNTRAAAVAAQQFRSPQRSNPSTLPREIANAS